MACAILLLIFAFAIVFLGTPVENVESLYYDADYSVLEAQQEDSDEDESTAAVAKDAKGKIATIVSEEELDVAKLAQEIYDDFD